MKVNNIKNLQANATSSKSRSNLQNSQSKTNFNNSPSFGNATDAMIKFWEAVDRGGLFASFTIQDMLGTNIPRTLAARNVGKEHTGKNNWVAVAENGVREFLTGPSMFAVPAAVLYGTMKAGGKAHGVPVESIKDFSDIISVNPEKYDTSSIEAFRKTFYKDVLDSTFSSFDTKEGLNIDKYVDDIIKMEGAKKKSFVENLKGVKVEGSKQDLMTDIIDSYIRDKKARTTGYPDFLTAKIKETSKEANFEKILDRMNKFSEDFYKTLKKSDAKDGITKSFVEGFSNRRMGGRFLTNIAMGVFTAAAMIVIPKLYTIGKTNPETDPVRQKANELKNGLTATASQNDEAKPNNGSEVSFQGGGISKIASQIGEKVSPAAKGKLPSIAANLESDWINVARPIYLTLISVCTLIPRCAQSMKRDIESSKQNGGKIQFDETANILRRDVTTILTILFAMKGMNSVMAHSATKKSGAVLTNKILPKEMSPLKKAAQFLKSKGGVDVLTEKQNASRLSYFANGSELVRMFEDTEAKSGNLFKMLHAGENARKNPELKKFSEAAKDLFGSLVDKTDVKASELKAVIEKEGADSEKVKKLLDLLNNKDTNPLLKSASSTNAWFQTLSLGIITAFLGFGLPKINDLIINRKYLKDGKTLQDKYKDPNVQIPGYSILNNLKPIEKQTYQYFLGNLK